MMKSRLFLSFFILITLVETGYSQSITLHYSKSVDSIYKTESLERKVTVNSDNFTITRDTLNRYPDSLMVSVKMTDFTLGVSCGVVCGCGTLKLKLLTKKENYREEYIYVAVPCLNVLPGEFINPMNVKLYKLPLYVDMCYFTELSMNKFDTKGIPFYGFENYNERK